MSGDDRFSSVQDAVAPATWSVGGMRCQRSTVNGAVMLVELRNELFAFAAFFDVVLYPGANLRLRGKESTGEPGQQLTDERGAALDFHFCVIEHAAVYFSVKMEQVPNL